MMDPISNITKILGKLRMSKVMKEKNNWSRDSGAGFVKEDIVKIELHGNDICFDFTWGYQIIAVSELNLRETEEAISFIESQTITIGSLKA